MAQKTKAKKEKIFPKTDKKLMGLSPHIEIGGQRYWRVECKKCHRAEGWQLFYNGKSEMGAVCPCGGIASFIVDPNAEVKVI